MKKMIVFLILLLQLAASNGVLAAPVEIKSPALDNRETEAYPELGGDQENNPPSNSSYGQDKFFGEFVRMLIILGSIIGAMLIFAWMAKKFLNTRMEQMNASGNIKVVERRILTPKTTVYILDLAGEQVALADSHHGVAFLRLPGGTFSFESKDKQSQQT